MRRSAFVVEDGLKKYRPIQTKTSVAMKEPHVLVFEGAVAQDLTRWDGIVKSIIPDDVDTMFISSRLRPLRDIARTIRCHIVHSSC